MLRSTSHLDEKTRLAGLRALDILDTGREDRFDRIARLATQVFGVPAATISFIDDEREWFKAAEGWAIKELPRDVAFGDMVIAETGPFVIQDTRKDDRTAEHELVQGKDGVHFYAGHPVRGPDGGNVGVLAILDERPRRLSTQDKQAMHDLALLVEDELGVRFGQEQADQVLPADHVVKLALEGLPWPAAALDEEGTIRSLNSQWRDALEPGGLLSPLDDVGRNHLANLESVEGFSKQDARMVRDGLRDVLHGNRDHFRHDYERGTGDDKRGFRVRINPIQMEGENWVLVMHEDRTEVMRRLRSEEMATEYGLEVEELRGVVQFQRRVLERYEQEMSAPATPIRLQLHMLKQGRKGKLTEEQEKSLATIARNVERWNDSVQDMMATLRRASDPSVKRRVMNLSTLADDVSETLATTALKEGINLHKPTHPPRLQVEVVPQEIRQVLSRYIEMAMSNTPSGGHVSVQLHKEGDNAVAVVHDGRAGVRPDEAKGIFSPSVDSRNGLGMYWCKRTIDRHGGKVWAEADPDGLTLGLRIPLMEGAEPEDGPTEGRREAPEGEADAAAPTTTRQRPEDLAAYMDAQTSAYQ